MMEDILSEANRRDREVKLVLNALLDPMLKTLKKYAAKKLDRQTTESSWNAFRLLVQFLFLKSRSKEDTKH